jgi:hypothetical protein
MFNDIAKKLTGLEVDLIKQSNITMPAAGEGQPGQNAGG